jgi:hypothetical protein
MRLETKLDRKQMLWIWIMVSYCNIRFLYRRCRTEGDLHEFCEWMGAHNDDLQLRHSHWAEEAQ